MREAGPTCGPCRLSCLQPAAPSAQLPCHGSDPPPSGRRGSGCAQGTPRAQAAADCPLSAASACPTVTAGHTAGAHGSCILVLFSAPVGGKFSLLGQCFPCWLVFKAKPLVFPFLLHHDLKAVRLPMWGPGLVRSPQPGNRGGRLKVASRPPSPQFCDCPSDPRGRPAACSGGYREEEEGRGSALPSEAAVRPRRVASRSRRERAVRGAACRSARVACSHEGLPCTEVSGCRGQGGQGVVPQIEGSAKGSPSFGS